MRPSWPATRSFVLQGNWRVLDLMSLGRIDEARAEIEGLRGRRRRLALPHYRWWVPMWTAAFALMAGEEEAARFGERALASATGPTTPTPSCSWASSASGAALSRPPSPRPCSPRSSPASLPAPWAWMTGLAWVNAALGRSDEARDLVERLTRDDLAALRLDANWHAVLDLCEALALLTTVRVPSASTPTWRPTPGSTPSSPGLSSGTGRSTTTSGWRSRPAIRAGRAPPGGSARRGRVDRRRPAGGGFDALLHRAREEIGR